MSDSEIKIEVEDALTRWRRKAEAAEREIAAGKRELRAVLKTEKR
jgi:hypothetical protein